MGNIAQKLEYLKDTKEAIKTAIVGKGGSIAEDANFRSYAETITNLPTGGGDDVEPIVLTGDCTSACKGSIPSVYIKLYGNTITTENITYAREMFYEYRNENIPFELNFSSNTNTIHIDSIYKGAKNLKTLPRMNTIRVGNISHMFSRCENLREVPEDYFSEFSFDSNINAGAYGVSWQSMYQLCHSLRKCPLDIYEYANVNCYQAYAPYYGMFSLCYALDEVKDLPIPLTAVYNANLFVDTFNECYRIKRITFKTDNEQPLIKNWKNQTINLSSNIGWAYDVLKILYYNSGITADKEVKDDATYQALKNDPDWFSTKIEYSRYNKTSAVETINSLPDTSAYLLENGGTNTIRLKGNAGSLTDGGAINTMTAEEIAVATAKGWTVSLE